MANRNYLVLPQLDLPKNKSTEEILEIAPKIAHGPVREIFSLDGVNILVGEVFEFDEALTD